ncbi:MAG: DUF6538 domain-containing protein [Promethearchaeia archaeon]
MTATTSKHIFQNSAGTYAVRLRVPENLRPILNRTELRRSLKTKDLEEAQKLAPAAVQALRQELDPRKVSSTPIIEAMHHLPDDVKPTHGAVLADLMGFTGCHNVEDITMDDWQRWCYRREDIKQRSVATVRQEAITTRAAILKLMAAQRKPFDRAILTNPRWRPMTKLEKRIRDKANSPYSLDRWQQLYDNMPSRLHTQKVAKKIFALGLFTGARISEIVHTHQSHIVDGLWSINRSKSIAGERIIPLIPQAQEVFDSLKPDEDGYLFVRDGRDWRDQNANYSNNVIRNLKKAGATPKIETMHSTRSTFRTLVPRCWQAPEGTIDMLMGHETKRHVSEAYFRATLDDCIELMSHWRPEVRLD